MDLLQYIMTYILKYFCAHLEALKINCQGIVYLYNACSMCDAPSNCIYIIIRFMDTLFTFIVSYR